MVSDWWNEKKYYHHAEWDGNDYVLFDKDDNEIDRVYTDDMAFEHGVDEEGEARQDLVDEWLKKAHYIQR
jgi:hypothetical protein